MKKVLAAITLLMITDISYSDDRRFTYTYESSTLAKNEKDLEVWTTYKGGRNYFYSAFENRFEYEVGLTNKLQTAFYVNFSNVTSAKDNPAIYDTEFEFKGISSEWKYQVLNKYRDGIGFSPYIELGLNTDEVKIETNLIADKQISKKFLAAFNAVFEYEWEYNPAPQNTAKKFEMEFDLGFAYDITDEFSIGLETRSHSEFPNGEGLEFSSLYLGPCISYRSDGWFMAMTYLPQITAFKQSVDSPGTSLELNDQERNNARIIIGFTL
ncbi:MAG TPA: hypothetical protein PKA90_07525 [Ignavibacteria bacterium]|nr:hypothetical protein [Ignavibacteria bacterium]HMR40266.1 hypothetical protein [Ignavibacteria bacterium]